MNGLGTMTIVVAMDKNRVIGKSGSVPWKLSADMKHFADYTRGKVVIMGRKTYDSLPPKFKPLPQRTNLILTHNMQADTPGCIKFYDTEDVLNFVQRSRGKEACVIGGAEIYKALLPFVDTLILTLVDSEVEGGDTFFPEIGDEWKVEVLSVHEKDDKNEFPFKILKYTRPKIG